MKITVFTSNQPRHIALINKIAEVAEVVYVVQEVSTVHPGVIADFYNNSEIMREYLKGVLGAEQFYFPNQRFTFKNVRSFPCKFGDLNQMSASNLHLALESDVYIIFGSSFIKGWLCDFLVKHNAINLHMGLSPYYRGAACNFWAMFDGRPNYVGATWHFLSNGLDSGPILFHSVPIYEDEDGFKFTMKAVRTAQEDFVSNFECILKGAFPGIEQNKKLEIRRSTYKDFTDEAAQVFLDRYKSPQELKGLLQTTVKPILQSNKPKSIEI